MASNIGFLFHATVLIIVNVMIVWLGLKYVLGGNPRDIIQKALKKRKKAKHEAYPVLIKVWSHFEAGNLHVPRLDLEHLKCRKLTHDFVLQYQNDFININRKKFQESYKYSLELSDYRVLKDSMTSSIESGIFELTAMLLTKSYQSTIDWLKNKELISAEVSALLYDFQDALLRVNSIIEDSKDQGIELELDTRKKIEDLMSPLLDDLNRIRLEEENSTKQLIIALNKKVNEGYQNNLEKELVLAGLKKYGK